MDLTEFRQALADVTAQIEGLGDPTERSSAAVEVYSAMEDTRNHMVAVATLQWQPPAPEPEDAPEPEPDPGE